MLVDEGGVSLRSLEMSDAQILHTSPNHQFPTGAVTPIGRRQSLLRWAEAREGRYIIEDDYDSEFRFTLRPIPTLQSIDRAGRVIYVNTFSRTLAPSLRISYMVLPKSLTERYRAQLGFYSSTVPAMEQYTLARFWTGILKRTSTGCASPTARSATRLSTPFCKARSASTAGCPVRTRGCTSF